MVSPKRLRPASGPPWPCAAATRSFPYLPQSVPGGKTTSWGVYRRKWTAAALLCTECPESANGGIQGRGPLCPLNVDPRHSIARDQRPLRVRPKSRAAIVVVADWDSPAREGASSRFGSAATSFASKRVLQAGWLARVVPHMRAGLDSRQQRLRLSDLGHFRPSARNLRARARERRGLRRAGQSTGRVWRGQATPEELGCAPLAPWRSR